MKHPACQQRSKHNQQTVWSDPLSHPLAMIPVDGKAFSGQSEFSRIPVDSSIELGCRVWPCNEYLLLISIIQRLDTGHRQLLLVSAFTEFLLVDWFQRICCGWRPLSPCSAVHPRSAGDRKSANVSRIEHLLITDISTGSFVTKIW